MVYQVEFNKEECIGCGACTQCNNWEMGDDGKAKPIKTKLNELGCNQEAADSCPVNVIKIKEVK